MEDCNDGRVYRFMRETTDAYYSEKAEGKLRIERVYVGGSDRVKQTLSKHVYDAHRDEFVGTVIKECVSWMTKDSDKGEDSDKNSDRSASDIVTLPVTAHASGSTDTKDDGGRLSTSNKVSAAPPTKQNEFDAPLVPDTPNIVGNVSALSAEMGLSDINTQNSHDQSHHLRDIILPFIAPQVASKVALPDSIWLSGPHEIYAFNGGYTNDDGKPGQYFLSIIPHYSPTKYPHRSAATVMYADNNSSMSKMHIVTNCFDIPGDNIDGGVYRNSCSKESSKDMCVEENMSQCNHSGSDERNEEIVKEHILILRDCMPYYLTSNKVRSTISETLSRFYSRDIIESGA